jgi:lysophospholipase L1-like esterase
MLKRAPYNIVCIGDSFTYGLQVDRADTYPKQLERLLNQANGPGGVNVYNLGIPGTNSSQHLKSFEGLINRDQHVGVLIILTGANDKWNLADSNIERVSPHKDLWQWIKTSASVFISDFRLYKMLKLIVLNTRGFSPHTDIDPFQQVLQKEKSDERVLRELLKYNLDKIITLAHANGIEVILLNYPRGGVYGGDIEKMVSNRYNVPFVDIRHVFAVNLKACTVSDLFLYDLSHPNKRGNQLMAEAIYKTIIDLGIFKKIGQNDL